MWPGDYMFLLSPKAQQSTTGYVDLPNGDLTLGFGARAETCIFLITSNIDK